MQVNLEDLRLVVDQDDPPAAAIEAARAAHYLDWHELGQKLFAEDLAAELARTGAKSLKHSARK
jgi:hypothetical protein